MQNGSFLLFCSFEPVLDVRHEDAGRTGYDKDEDFPRSGGVAPHLGHFRRTFIMEEDKTGTISEGGMVRYFVLSYSIVKDGNYHAFLL